MPARKGSKGVPNKNIRPFGLDGVSLLSRAVREAIRLHPDEIILTTDYAQAELPTGARKFYAPRPEHLATDKAGMLDVLADLAHKCAWGFEDRIVLFQPSSIPVRHWPGRAELVGPYLDTALTIISAWRVPDRWHPAYCINPHAPERPPETRQDLAPFYRPNGLFYVMNGVVAASKGLWDNPTFVETDCFNIDTQADWDEAEQIYGREDDL